MKLHLDCIPCVFRQTLEASRMTIKDEEITWEVMKKVARIVSESDPEKKTPAIVRDVQEFIKEKSEIEDLYQDFKEKHINLALDIYPEAKEIVKESDNPLVGSLVMAAMGNSIDAGANFNVNIKENLERAVEDGFTYSDFDLFKQKLKSGSKILIIADNSGEAVFDRLLIKELNKHNVEIIYAVREAPILNDITEKEAKEIGIDKLAKVISSGCNAPGMLMEEASQEFKQIFKEAELVISKGQGNFEGLSEEERPVFFLLQAKCELVARQLGVEEGSLVFKLD